MSPPDPTPAQPPSDREDALAVLKRLRDAGHVAYFAGGCVRDLLLNLPAKDYDVATDAPPDRVRAIFPNTQAVGAAFGVILVRQRKSMIEVATFRTDGDYSDGRRPDSVRFTTAEEDAQRRDFTINGLFLDPIENKVIDYVGGQADLAAKVIRAIGDPAARFSEDYLRMLRAIRFAARLGFEIEPATADAIRLEGGSIARVSPERIADELRRMLIAPTRGLAWDLLELHHLTPRIFRSIPHAELGRGLIAEVDRHAPITFPLALAIILADFYLLDSPAEEMSAWIADGVRKVRALFKLSNEERDSLRAILTDAAALLKNDGTLAARMRFMARPDAADTRSLLGVLANIEAIRPRVAAVELLLHPLESVECNPPQWVTGDDLVAAGLHPGPGFKKVLDAVYDAQLESRVQDKPAAMAMALQLATQTK